MGKNKTKAGFTIVEVLVSIAILSAMATSVLLFYATMVQSALTSRLTAEATVLANNQIEDLKSLPYNSLAVIGGSIVATNPLPASFSTTINNFTYTTSTSINYVDDAFDGCGYYPTVTLKNLYCQNQPAPAGAPATDTNAADYKTANVKVKSAKGLVLAEIDTKISARVAETASNTGAMFIKVIDASGNPLSGVNVAVANTSLNPNINVNDSTDSNGVAIFYGLPPDTSGYDYKITASLSGYSTLSTIAPSGSLQPIYSNLQLISQQSSSSTLTLLPQGTYSLLAEAVDTAGNPINNLKVYMKGGYKKYTSTANTSYYFDNFSPSDNRPTTDSNGNFVLTDLAPGPYFACGDNGSSNCKIGSTTYYLLAAAPYAGTDVLNPITIPSYISSSPPSTTFAFGGNEYLQKVRLIFSTNSSYPRLTDMTPSTESLSSGVLNNFAFTLTGVNLPCSSNPASCSTTVKIYQGSNLYTASCTGSAAGTSITCTANLSGVIAGNTGLVITSGGNTLTIPAGATIGGPIITP